MARLRRWFGGTWPTSGASPLETASGTWLVRSVCGSACAAATAITANAKIVMAKRCLISARNCIGVFLPEWRQKTVHREECCGQGDKERMDLSAELFTTKTLRHGEIQNGVLRASVVEN